VIGPTTFDLILGGETAANFAIQSVIFEFGTGPDRAGTGVPTPNDPPAIPESSTWAMMLAGFGGLGYAAFRRNRAKRLGPALA
jgi:hypothetical protein